MKRLIWMGCALYLLIGLAHVVLGSILIQMIDHYGLEYRHGGMLIFLQFSGFLVGVVSVPHWAHHVGRRGVVIVALAALFIGQTVYSILPAWHWMVIIAPVVGFGFGIIEAVISAMILELQDGKKAIAISKIEVFFGVGALIMPLAASLFIAMGQWQISFPFIALYTLIVAIIWQFMNFQEINEHFNRKAMVQQAKKIKKRYPRHMLPALFLFISFFFVYVGVEMSFVNFLPAMLKENNLATEATASISVSVFWATMAIGRMFAGIIAERINYARYLIYGCAGSLLFLMMFSFTGHVWSTYAAIIGYGLFMSGLFAIGLVAADQAFPGLALRTISYIVAAGGIGGAVLPLLTGWSMDEFSLPVTKWGLVSSALLLLFIAIAAIRFSRRRSVEQSVEASA